MKKFTKDIRILVAAFVLLFVALGGLAINAAVSRADNRTGSPTESEGEPTLPDAFTTIFNFKAEVLDLEVGDSKDISFVVITNAAAIVGGSASSDAVLVETNPFAIKALRVGQACVYLSARFKNGDIKIINCIVNVTGQRSGAEEKKDLRAEGYGSQDDGGGEGQSKEPIIGTLEVRWLQKYIEIEFELFAGETSAAVTKLTADIAYGAELGGGFGNRRSFLTDTEFKAILFAEGELEDGRLVYARLEVSQNCL